MRWLFAGPHKCCAGGCTTIIDRRYIACDAHWTIVPPALRDVYFRLYKNGRPRDGFEEACDNIAAQIQDAVQ